MPELIVVENTDVNRKLITHLNVAAYGLSEYAMIVLYMDCGPNGWSSVHLS